MSKALEAAWAEAFLNPGEFVPVGRTVVCDDCDKDWTESPQTGGLLFGSKGICPDCEEKWRTLARQYNEERFIKGVCPAGESFADFVRRMRGPDAGIKVTVWR